MSYRFAALYFHALTLEQVRNNANSSDMPAGTCSQHPPPVRDQQHRVNLACLQFAEFSCLSELMIDERPLRCKSVAFVD